MAIINSALKTIISDIVNNKYKPTKVYKSISGDKFTIEFEYKNPMGWDTVYYSYEVHRNKDFLRLEFKVFHLLPFNPYIIKDYLNVDNFLL